MNIQAIINGLLGVSLAYGLSQVLPARPGYWLAERLGGWVGSRQRWPMVRAVRANQWVVGGGRWSEAALSDRVRAVFRSNARCLYDYYHLLHRPQAILNRVDFDPAFEECIRRSQEGRAAQMLVIPHFSNFDLVGRAAALKGMQFQVLSYAQPQAGYQWQNELRNFKGMRVTPISNESLRQAAQRLRAGGTVLTGADRPLGEAAQRPRFFGRPANLPGGYTRLALRENAPIIVIAGITLHGGRYRAWASPPITMKTAADPATETLRNSEAVLEVIEGLIRQAPEQWSMFYPVWPQALAELSF